MLRTKADRFLPVVGIGLFGTGIVVFTLFLMNCAHSPVAPPPPQPVVSPTFIPDPQPPVPVPPPALVPPTRDKVLGVKITFQGLTVKTQQFGVVPWFEPWIASLNAEDRKAVYAAKKARGDTHIIIGFSKGGIIYNESPFQRFTAPNYERNTSSFLALLEEFITAGFIPIVTFDGDNADNPVDGYPNALRQLPILVSILKTSKLGDLNKFVLYARFWDGVFYGSTPQHIKDFGAAFRALLPNGYLGIEHSTGHIPVGNGPGDYSPGGLMVDYDAIFSEFNDWAGEVPLNTPTSFDKKGQPNGWSGDQIWQIAGRLLGPGYHRPQDQPKGDDPAPPGYLQSGNPRGPYYPIAFEYDEYRWVRSRVTASQVESERAYLKAMGWKWGDL